MQFKEDNEKAKNEKKKQSSNQYPVKQRLTPYNQAENHNLTKELPDPHQYQQDNYCVEEGRKPHITVT